MAGFWEVTLGGLLGSGVASAIAATVSARLMLRRSRLIESEIKRQFDERLKVFESTRIWKEKCLSQLLGPAVMQLERTKRAFDRWDTKNLYLEAKIVRDGNVAVRDLLLSNGHLIPPPLMEDAARLVEHYDRWIEEFETKRAKESPTNEDTFVFVGPQGFPFPSQSEKRFLESFRKLQQELYCV